MIPEMGVDPHCGGAVGVAEEMLGGQDVDASLIEDRRVGVAQAVGCCLYAELLHVMVKGVFPRALRPGLAAMGADKEGGAGRGLQWQR